VQHRNPQTIKFLDSIKAELHSYGFRFLIGKGQQLNSGEGWRSSGFFDEDKRIIKVAGGGGTGYRCLSTSTLTSSNG